MTNFISKKILSTLIIIMMLLFAVQTFAAATVKLVKKSIVSTKSLPPNSTPILYFDEESQLRLRTDKPDFSYYLSNVCNSKLVIDGNPTHQIILQEPRVDVQRCLPSAPYPYDVDYLFGLNSDDHTSWKHQLTVPLNAKDGDYRTVIGASKDGIILHSIHTGLVEILDPLTGEVLYPYKDKPSIITKELGSAAYDPEKQVLYQTTYDFVGNKPSLLNKIDLKTGDVTQLAQLPEQFLTKVPAGAYSVILTFDKHYLVIGAHIASRFNAHDIFMVYDLKENKWLYQKTVETPSSGVTMIVADTKTYNIGLLSNNGRGKLTISHFIISDETAHPTLRANNAPTENTSD